MHNSHAFNIQANQKTIIKHVLGNEMTFSDLLHFKMKIHAPSLRNKVQETCEVFVNFCFLSVLV